MDPNVPYLLSVTNLPGILDKIQGAGVPEVFNRDFLKDLGFTGSQDRPVVKILKYLGLLDPAGRPQTPYRDFVDHTKSRKVLAIRLRTAFDDLFRSDRQAHTKSAEALKGWFKSKTGVGDAVAKKMASTFRALAQYADFAGADAAAPEAKPPEIDSTPAAAKPIGETVLVGQASPLGRELGFVYRIEVHLPDTQNVETFRAIFRAIREELLT